MKKDRGGRSSVEKGMKRSLRWHGDRGLDWRLRKIRKPQAKIKGRIAGTKGHGNPNSDRKCLAPNPGLKIRQLSLLLRALLLNHEHEEDLGTGWKLRAPESSKSPTSPTSPSR